VWATKRHAAPAMLSTLLGHLPYASAPRCGRCAPVIQADATQTFHRIAIVMVVGRSGSGGLSLRGRRDECAVNDRLREGAQAGRSGMLVVVGEAGIGKTALVDYAIASASEMRVVRASGWSRRWSWHSQRCISCARRWSIALTDFPLLSATRWRSPRPNGDPLAVPGSGPPRVEPAGTATSAGAAGCAASCPSTAGR
jgi:hypothetical protein